MDNPPTSKGHLWLIVGGIMVFILVVIGIVVAVVLSRPGPSQQKSGLGGPCSSNSDCETDLYCDTRLRICANPFTPIPPPVVLSKFYIYILLDGQRWYLTIANPPSGSGLPFYTAYMNNANEKPGFTFEYNRSYIYATAPGFGTFKLGAYVSTTGPLAIPFRGWLVGVGLHDYSSIFNVQPVAVGGGIYNLYTSCEGTLVYAYNVPQSGGGTQVFFLGPNSNCFHGIVEHAYRGDFFFENAS